MRLTGRLAQLSDILRAALSLHPGSCQLGEFFRTFHVLEELRRYTENRRGRKETEVARRVKGGIKRRETDPASNQFPECSPQPGTQRFTELGGEEKGKGGDRGDLVEEKESQKGREHSGQ